jgi:hypothetical protein
MVAKCAPEESIETDRGWAGISLSWGIKKVFKPFEVWERWSVTLIVFGIQPG